ncbi:alkaline phosphatase family protein [Rhodocytophaga rosea]|uniref:Alkaline phosphatase family protein n=1 Tax=Rhodocytophaga rosea TaxID=2704465 RepID=A0A6C0GIB8_9BACT|nr:alkaline phosphatase D family protein [Rhodocytophaga rosea]QHT67776.1 alkaline phosphatase family protein [Rhodocytophaga rosea]
MRNTVLTAFCFVLLMSLQVHAQTTLLQSGPMVGYSDMKEVALWVQTTQDAKVKCMYWEKDAPQKKFSTEEITTTKNTAFTATLKADQVSPGKKYTYELYINGKNVKRPYPLEFQTQTLWQWRTDPPEFTFATGSCTYINETDVDRPGKPYGGDYDIFTTIYQQKPDFMLWLGDNTYLREVDWNTRSGIMHRYTHTRSTPEMQPLLGSVHNYATWDDHDFGPNNANRSFWNKNITLEAFKLFWPSANYVLGEKAGVTSTFQWNDVQFFLVDDRYFKTPNENFVSSDRTLLGKEQLQWLVDALISSDAPFKIVAIGCQVLNPAKLDDSYTYYQEEKDYLLKAIQEAKIPGVIFLDGDRHHSSLTKLERPGTYPLYDITISPLTAGVYTPKADENALMIPGTLVAEHNFALINVKGPRTDRTLTIRVLNTKGKEMWTQELKAKELK